MKISRSSFFSIVPGPGAGRRKDRAAFTLMELLAVVSVMAILLSMAGPALRALTGAGSVSQAAADLSRTLELARIQAMTQQTYVRVVFSDIPGKGTMILCLYSADGTLDAATKADMEDVRKWPQIGKAMLLDNFCIDDSLQAGGNLTDDDAKPSDSRQAGSGFVKFTRAAAGVKVGSAHPEFDQYVQFSPSGEARVKKDSASRYIKIGIDRAGVQAGQNPFIVRLSGASGSLHVFRKENL